MTVTATMGELIRSKATVTIKGSAVAKGQPVQIKAGGANWVEIAASVSLPIFGIALWDADEDDVLTICTDGVVLALAKASTAVTMGAAIELYTTSSTFIDQASGPAYGAARSAAPGTGTAELFLLDFKGGVMGAVPA